MLYRPSGMRRTLAVLIAGLIAACAPSGSFQHPERVSYVQNGDAKLRVFVEGNGPAIVLLPGQGRGPRDLDALARELVASWYRVFRPELVSGVVLIAAGGRFPPKPEVMAGLRKVQDKNLSLEERAEAARAVLYGPRTAISATDMRLDEVSAKTIVAQSLAPTVPVEVWWDGGKAPMLLL